MAAQKGTPAKITATFPQCGCGSKMGQGLAFSYLVEVRLEPPQTLTRGLTPRDGFRPVVRILASIVMRALFIAVLVSPVAAKELATGDGAIIDMPSGFTPGDGEGKIRYAYLDANKGMEFDILIFEPGRYSSAELMAKDLLGQMGSKGDVSSFTYQDRGAVIADLAFAAGDVPRKGYAVFISGEAGSGDSYALVASTETSRFDSYSELIISCLDAFSIDRAARTEKKTAFLPAGSVSLPWSSKEEQDELSVAKREFRVLTMYLKSETLWQDAWARYYRMVYKESAAELDNLTQAFSVFLPLNDPTESARRVLAWVQGFHYERDFAGIDFVIPLTAAFEQRGDCDSRAMVMAIILERLGIDCILMVSREYSHAMVAVDVPGGGQRFTFNGKAYLVAETTAKVGIGMIDSTQADFSKWLGVDVGE